MRERARRILQFDDGSLRQSGWFSEAWLQTVIAEAPAEKEHVLVAEIDVGRIEEVRRNWPFLRDRRVDAYGGLDRRFLDAGS